ncbi:glycosyltransferase [Salinibacterium hongtaonis]|uniref:Glycosyl transferase family 2 n=1 Tax=Homoserinimonas hongtaonis TaxID=2079791 RepID=A0A2U1T116_9MICO|nr:glycosyltransferase [Salinibacterium hongtaonis]PWB97569.1 glycosyl transferase family 2 [Salinibacterium hongtaonis]
MTASSLSVVIAVLTYQRPDDLAELIPLLREQAQAEASSALVSILIVDNDPSANASGWSYSDPQSTISYVHEPVPGIAAARNRALDSAGDADILIFIDDDERPSPLWLHLLLETYRSHDAPGVVGPVISRFSCDPEPWIVAGRFFDRRRLPTGTPVDVAATNNLLLDLRRVGSLRFDPAFGLSGGSDTLFTRELVRREGHLIWCDEATVDDIVPPARLTRNWVLARAFRSGNSWSRTSIHLADDGASRLATRLRLSASGLARVASGGLLSAAGVVGRTPHLHARGLRRLNRGGGIVSGAWGHVYSEYRRS